MGADCCSGKEQSRCQPANPPPPPSAHEHTHASPHVAPAADAADDAIDSCDDASTLSCLKGDDCSLDDRCDNDSHVDKKAFDSCCAGKDKCCDEKCIVSAAAAECEQDCRNDGSDATGHKHEHAADGSHSATPCESHMTKAFQQYSSYLEQARCICRSVLEIGLPVVYCGVDQKAHSLDLLQSTSFSSAHAIRFGAKSHHHHPKGPKGRNKKQHQRRVSEEHGHDHDHDHDHDGHGHGHGDGHAHNHGHMHGHEKAHGHGHGQDLCCSGDGTAPDDLAILPLRPMRTDIEKSAGLDHVSLVVEGMDCSSCGTKLERALMSEPGVFNVRVNFVMGSAEFDLDPEAAVGSLDAILLRAEKATTKRIKPVIGGDQTIDLLASGDAANAIVKSDIGGVSDITIVNKKMVRITYNPAIVGARRLIELTSNMSTGLAPPGSDPSLSSGRKHLYDMLWKTILAAILTIPVAVFAFSEDLVDKKIEAIIELVLATFVQIIAIPVFYRPAISSLIYDKSVELDMLVTISITAAYFYSVVAFGFRMVDRPLEQGEFFETSSLLITLVLAGRLVAAYARMRAVSAVSMRSLQASTAVLVEDGKDREIDSRLLQLNDTFRVPPHSRVPTDGVVISGTSEVDESMLTGESMPVVKKTGDKVIAGTLNGSGSLTVDLTRLPGKNTVTDIATLVEGAANSKPRVQDLADKVAGWFVPVVGTVAILVFVIWTVVGLKVRGDPASKAIPDAITYAVAVLAVSCPCALGLAVPMVLVIGGGIAARRGVIIKSAECTSEARKITDAVFDKTGTLTESALEVVLAEYLDSDPTTAAAVAKALTASNNHPVSLAVAKYLSDVKAASLSEVRSVPGFGVRATEHGALYQAGNPNWTKNSDHAVVKKAVTSGLTTLLITRDNNPIALFGLRARLRPDAKLVLQQLASRNIVIHLVSGDHQRAVETIASELSIPAANVAAQRTPAEKQAYVSSLIAAGKTVLFCGDGINDAVAVSQANVGVQLSGKDASDITQSAADVVLLAGLEGIVVLLDISQAAFSRIVMNLVWSAVYNVFAILLAAGALVKVRIEPQWAGLGEAVSVLPIIAIALSLLIVGRH
ncbi:hypothetical protein OQA88_6005 [Cercophora sp. LCS_1]